MVNSGASRSKLDLWFALLSVLSIVLIVLESNSSMLHTARIVMSITVKPLIEVAQVPSQIGNLFQVVFEERDQLRERNKELDQQNKKLREELINLKDAELRSAWMAELLEATDKTGIPVLSAKPMAIQLQPHAQKIVVDRGSRDGVFLGQSVIDHRGVIGQVTSISLTDAAITLITDSNHSLSVRIRRNGIKALVHGLGVPDQLLVSGLRDEQDIEVGDVLVTTGFGEKFPVGYPVAEVISVDRNENTPFATISAMPLAAHDPGFEVMMVWQNNAVNSDEAPVVTLND